MLMSCVNVAVFCFQPFFFFNLEKSYKTHRHPELAGERLGCTSSSSGEVET